MLSIGGGAPANKALQLTGASVASLPLAPAAETGYVSPSTHMQADLLRNVLVPSKIERWTTFASSPKRRRQFLHALYHFADFDPDVVVNLPPALDNAPGVLGELRRRGAAESCRIISAHRALDGSTMLLADAVDRIQGVIDGTLIICGPRLAYFEGEPPKNRCILQRL
jgi:hypothetical protein